MPDIIPNLKPSFAAVAAPSVALAAMSAVNLNLLTSFAGGLAAPALAAAGVTAQAAKATATTWQDNKTVTNQWTINQDRNSWMGVSGLGWQKLSTASDSGSVALTMLAASAIVSKRPVNFRQESDGMVHEIYLL